MGLEFDLVDIDPHTSSISPEELEKKADNSFDAVLVPQPYGITARMERIKEITNRYDLEIIEDVGYSIGATYNKKYAGTFGMGAIPLSPGKAVTTAEGGVVVTNNSEYKRLLRLLSHVSMNVEDRKSVVETGRFDPLEQSRELDFGCIGTSSRMSSLQAGIGLRELDRFQKNQSEIEDKFQYLVSNLKDIDRIKLYPVKAQKADSKINPNSRFISGYIEDIPRDLFIYCMMKEKTPIKMRYKDLFEYSTIEILDNYSLEEFPKAKFYSENNIFIPVEESYSKDYMDDLIAATEKCIEALKNQEIRKKVEKRVEEERGYHV